MVTKDNESWCTCEWKLFKTCKLKRKQVEGSGVAFRQDKMHASNNFINYIAIVNARSCKFLTLLQLTL